MSIHTCIHVPWSLDAVDRELLTKIWGTSLLLLQIALATLQLTRFQDEGSTAVVRTSVELSLLYQSLMA